MIRRFYIASLFIAAILIACNDSSINSTSGLKNETKTSTKEDIDGNFNDFIDKFSTDSIFQISRIKFPLKSKWYDLDNDRDSIIYKEKSNFKMMDFRKKKSAIQQDQWEQKIVIGKDHASATIEIRGIENGIMVDYLFEKINGVWMLIEIEDSST